jgi:hypothetical protein
MPAVAHDSLDHTVIQVLSDSNPILGFVREPAADRPTRTTGDLYLGRLPGGEKVYVHLQLAEHSEVKQSIEHEPVSCYVQLSITGHTRLPGRRGWESGGQIVDTVVELAHEGELAQGLTPELLLHLVTVWRAWHLNGLRAGCLHQHVAYEYSSSGAKQLSTTNTETCPLSGYRYGSAWLVRPLEARVVAFLSEFAVQVRQAKENQR